MLTLAWVVCSIGKRNRRNSKDGGCGVPDRNIKMSNIFFVVVFICHLLKFIKKYYIIYM